MSRKNVRGLMFSMEDLDETVVDTGDDVSVDPEIVEDAAAIDTDNDAFDESTDGLAALENIAIAIEETLENDGLSEDAAKIADISIEHICNRLGMKNSKLLVATEQFGSSNTRLAATRISLEEGMWDTIKEGYKKAIEWIKEKAKTVADFFRKLVSGFTWQEKKIKDLDQKVTSLGNRKIQNATFEDGGLCEKFRFAGNGSSATPEGCMKTLENTTDTTTYVIATIRTFKADSPSVIFKNKVPEKGQKTLLGGQVFTVDADTGTMQITSKPGIGGSGSVCKTMSTEEMKLTLSAATKLLNYIRNMITKDVDINKTANDLVSALKKAEGEAKSASDKKEISEKRQVIMTNAGVIFRVSGTIPKLGISTVAAALAYVNKSCAQYAKE